MKQKKQNTNAELVMMPQVIETADGFTITDPCLAAQVAKGAQEMGMTTDDAVAVAVRHFLATH